MGRKNRGKGKASQGLEGSTAPVDRGTLAQCLNATSQIAAECNSILRDLLRGRSPQHHDLQRLASQVLMGQTMNLQELQKKMESQQATLAELLKALKPSAGAGGLELGAHDISYQLPEPSMSIIKGWDSYRESSLGAAAARRRRPQKGPNGAGGRHDTHSKRERYLTVEGYWRSMSSQDRRSMLSAPVCKVLEVASTEGGPEGCREVMDGLRLLKYNGSRHACYWRCPCCDLRTPDPQAFLAHLASYHEEVQYSTEDTPMLCTSCGQEIVGAFFHEGDVGAPTAAHCLKCSWGDGMTATTGTGGLHAPAGWKFHVPQPTSLLGRTWSGSLASTEAMTASSGGVSARSSLGSGSDEEEAGGPSESLVTATEATALEARVRNGADGLLGALAHRIDALARVNRPQFEMALTAVVQRAQQLMHGPPIASKYDVGEQEGSPGRREAAERLRCAPPPTPPISSEGHEEALVAGREPDIFKQGLMLLTPPELQDLLALMARRYSPHPNHHLAPKSYEAAPYEPMCWSLLFLSSNNSSANKSITNGASSSNSTAVVVAGGGDNVLQNHGTVRSPPVPGSGFENLPEVLEDDVIEAQAWWAEHLAQKSWHDLGSRDDAYLLQWIYGNVAHGATDEFLERQRLACGTKSADAAVMDAFGEVAETWRHLAATMDRKRHVSTLRDAVGEDMEAAIAFDNELVLALRAQSVAFFEEVEADPALAAAAEGAGPMDAAWSQRALGKLQRFHELKDEGSIRYAQALIDREIAVLELAEVMDQHELDVAEREITTVDAALAAARQDLADAESELARIQAEGPALHRKRDLLDRVNKEAEHRERLQELQQHIAACKERIGSEETFGAGARQRREEAASDLDDCRAELQGYLQRRQALDRACHAVLAAQERDKGQELTDAYVDARIKAVWQVVAGVADGIRRLHDRYAPGSNSKEANRHARCTTLAKSLTSELDERIRVWWDELDKLRRRAADLACVDAGQAVESAALEAVRQSLEAQAAAAREAAIVDLLQELEAEEAAKKAAESKKAKKKAGKSGKKGAKEEGNCKSSLGDGDGGVSGGGASGDVSGAEGEGDLEESAEIDPEMEYEAALVRRRMELEQQELERLRQEAEALRLAQEASLRETATNANGNGKAAKLAGKPGSQTPLVVAVPSLRTKTSIPAVAPALKSPEKQPPRVVIVPRATPGTPSRALKSIEIVRKDGSGIYGSTSSGSGSGSGAGMSHAPPPPPSPAPLASGSGGTAPAPVRISTTGEMRIITYYGDWICFCNRTNRLWDTCTCGQIPPCRDWVRGRCTYKDRCRFAHPPFELPDNLPRPKSPIAKPGPDATVYKKPSKAGTAGPPTVQHVPIPLSSSSSSSKQHAGGSSEAKHTGGSATRTVVAVPIAKAAPAPAPPPLKPAPWASVRPGMGVQASPAAAAPASVPTAATAAAVPAAVHPSSTDSGSQMHSSPARAPSTGVTPLSRPSLDESEPMVLPPPVPPHQQIQQTLHEPAAPLPPPPSQQQQQHHSFSSAADFDPFGTSLLVHALGVAPEAIHPQSNGVQITSAFPTLSLGPALTPTSPPGHHQVPTSTHHLFTQGGAGTSLGPTSFLGGLSSDGTNPAAAVFQPSHHLAHSLGYTATAQPFSPPPPSHPHSAASPLGVGVLGGLPPGFDTNVGSLGAGLGSSMGGAGAGTGAGSEYDDWSDLQLQLPSDLGEMLGPDPVSPQHQVHNNGASAGLNSGLGLGLGSSGTGLYSSGGSGGGNGNTLLPQSHGWGAF